MHCKVANWSGIHKIQTKATGEMLAFFNLPAHKSKSWKDAGQI
jgi:hypothetical protein